MSTMRRAQARHLKSPWSRLLPGAHTTMIFACSSSPEAGLTTFRQNDCLTCRRLGYTCDELPAPSRLCIISRRALMEARGKTETLQKKRRLLSEKELVGKPGDCTPVEIGTRIGEVEGRTPAFSIPRDAAERR